MRKNRTKHEAKKPRLAKRALALCFALIFVCSCLLPAFANSEVGALSGTQETVVEQQDEQQPEELSLLNESGTDSTEGNEPKTTDNPTEGNEQNPPANNPTEGNEQNPPANNPTEESKPAEQEPKADEPKNEEPKTEGTTESKDSTEEQPKNEDSTKQQGNEQTKPEEPKTEETKPEGTTEETKTEETKPEEPKQPTTNTTGDTIEQGKATYTYRFWPDKIDALDLEAIDDAVKKNGETLNDAAQSRAGMVPCTVLTVMTNANLRDYQANVQQPTKPGYEFAGWYTVDGTTEDEFSFEQSLNFEKSKTIDVFAKWNKLEAVKSDALSNGGMTVEAKVGPMANVKSVALAEPSQSDAEKLRNSIDKQLYDQSYMVTIFDITPKDKDGMDVEPQNGESVNVEISGLGFSTGDNVWVYHLTNFGRVETLSATVTSDGGVEFTTKSFSPFAVVKLTEGMVGFGTEDDRLATADWSENYTMMVGESKTLDGGGYLSINHNWGSDNTDVVEVTGSGSSATVKAKSPGPAIVTHTYGAFSTHVERATITVKEDPTSYPLYIYAKMSDTVKSQLEKAGGEALSINAHGWFTLGKVDSVTGLGDPKVDGAGQNGKPKYTSGWKYKKATDSLKNNVDRYGKNAQVNLDDVSWNHTDVGVVQFGLTTADGATDYTNNGIYTWHLDGYIESLSAVVVNYYIDRDGTPTQISKSSETHLGSPGRTYELTEEERKESIPYEGRTYTLTRMEPTTGTQIFPESGKVAAINLYYGLKPSTNTMTKDTPYINVEKRFTGITEKQIPSDFAIQIGGHTLTRRGLNPATVTTENGDIVLRWKLDGVDVGKYDITETGTTVPGYKLETEKVTGTGTTVTVAAKEYNITYADRITSCKNQKLTVTVKQNDNESKFIVISATANTNIILSEYPFSASQRASVASYLSTAPGVFKTNTTNEFYSIKESTSFTIAGANVTYDKAAGTVRIGATNEWNQVLMLSCATDEGKNPEVKIVNPYTPATTSLTVTKHVAVGNAKVPDNAEFKFKLTVGNEEQYYKGVTFDNVANVTHTTKPNEWTFTLKADDSIKISGIRLDDTDVKVEEVEVDSKHYSTKYSVNNGTAETGTTAAIPTATLSANQADGTTVEFTNTYNVPNLDSMTIKKVVTGAFGERTKDFAFSVTLSNDKRLDVIHSFSNPATTGALDSFSLKHGEYVTLWSIPIGTTITITESNANDYDTSATNYDKAVNKTFVYEVVNENGTAVLKSRDNRQTVADNAIVVTNDFDGNPDTGVLLDTLPYLILLAVAVAGGVLVVVRKRKHRDE